MPFIKFFAREHWSSTWGFRFALAGSLIGVGNIWRFPRLVEQYGMWFLVIYVLLLILVGYPLMLVGLAIGKRGQANAAHSFAKIKPRSKWILLGKLAILTAFVLLTIYSVIGGWSVAYLVGSFQGFKRALSQPLFTNASFSMFYALLFLLLTAVVVQKGIKKGIEKICFIVMPLVFALLLILTVHMLASADSVEAISKTLDWKPFNLKILAAAFGHMMFSLSIGVAVMITYGGHLQRKIAKINIARDVLVVVVMDLLASLLATMISLPLFVLNPIKFDYGMGVLFERLPVAFSLHEYGKLLAPLFFVLLVLAALTSAFSLLEVVVSFFIEKYQWSRLKSVVVVTLLVFLFAVPSALSVNVLAGFKINELYFIDFLSSIAGVVSVLVALMCCVFIVKAWSVKQACMELATLRSGFTLGLIGVWVKYVLPIVLTLFILLKIIIYLNIT